MLYLIDQLKLQFIVCYEGLQWYMLYLIDQSKLQFIFCYEGLQWYVISDRSVIVTVCFFTTVDPHNKKYTVTLTDQSDITYHCRPS
jgi:hypothetical protein